MIFFMSALKTKLGTSCLLLGCIILPYYPLVKAYGLVKMVELAPPPAVRGMTKLDKTLFDTSIEVPCLTVKSKFVTPLVKVLNKYLLKLCNFKPVTAAENSKPVNDKSDANTLDRFVFLNPVKVSNFSDIAESDSSQLEQLGIDESCFHIRRVNLSYDNWSADDVLAAVLPEGVETAAGYSQVGHIVHLNLREHLQDYKYLIGQVLLDKIKPARTVVNKVDSIDNKFRVFNMEVLAGEPEFVTEVKENYVRFKFDFSAVYWNPRLVKEHERIVDKLNPGNVLYDVFAGVGPFSVPAAKKKCTVLANDLNPESFRWLQYNSKLNKVETFLSAFNKDGADFIKEDVKHHILKEGGKKQSHLVMNLPSIAVTFLSAFKHMFSVDELQSITTLPLVHVYCFVKGVGDAKDMAAQLVEKELNCSISDIVDEITFVRNVAPNKEMMRVSFQLTEKIVQNEKRKLKEEIFTQELKKSKDT